MNNWDFLIKEKLENGDDLILSGYPNEKLPDFLKAVPGNLHLTNCPNLTSLNELRHVTGTVYIEGCPKLKGTGLLNRAGGNITIINCESFSEVKYLEYGNNITFSRLPNMRDLGSLETVYGFLDVTDTPISNLGRIYFIEGEIYAAGSLLDPNNDELCHFNGKLNFER